MDKNETKQEAISKGWMGLVMGLALLTAGVLASQQLHVVWTSWPCTDAAIVSGSVQESWQQPYGKGETPIRLYLANVSVQYSVKGRGYAASLIAPFTANTYNQAAAALAQSYTPNTRFAVRYNPRNPREVQFATFDLAALSISFLFLTGGVVFLAFGSNSLVSGYFRRRETEWVPTKQAGGNIVRFPQPALEKTWTSKIYCAHCGQPVQASDESCPNCLKRLHAA